MTIAGMDSSAVTGSSLLQLTERGFSPPWVLGDHRPGRPSGWPIARLPRRPPLSAEPLQRGYQGEMHERVRDLFAPAGLEVGQQVQLAAVVSPVTGAAERHHALGFVAAAQRARDQVSWVDPLTGADQAALTAYLLPLSRRSRADRSSAQRHGAPKRARSSQSRPPFESCLPAQGLRRTYARPRRAPPLGLRRRGQRDGADLAL